MAKESVKQPDAPAEKPADETIKETIESIVIAFVLAFVFRAYVVEAFVIPTGSMAPTLLGQHVNITCDECGYGFDFDVPEDFRKERVFRFGREYTVVTSELQQGMAVQCPICGAPYSMPKGTRIRAGDRILVQKYVYSMFEPRRWDVVVFKAPHDPQTNFIKRLVGLPEEQLRLLDGNVYVKPTGGQWQIARKTDRPRVQRAVWQPIYHSQYVPLDGGTEDRQATYRWQEPWVAKDTTADLWQIENRRSYRYDGDQPGRIVFDFARGHFDSGPIMYPYNQGGSEPTRIEDVRIAATFQPDTPGLALKLSTTARLSSRKSVDILTASIDADGLVRLIAVDPDTARETELDKRQIDPMPAGANTRVELWYVDQEASVWVNGKRTAGKKFDPGMEVLAQRGPPPWTPDIAIQVSGSRVRLHNVEVDRDLYYIVPRDGNGPRARGGVIRLGDGRLSENELVLGKDEFYCLGDNSPRSMDSRYWPHVNPWITRNAFDGVDRPGLVPRQLMIGRAFFVYFPAPYPWKRNAPGIFPNFGRMRFIH